jgi:hypothetical protein
MTSVQEVVKSTSSECDEEGKSKASAARAKRLGSRLCVVAPGGWWTLRAFGSC